MSQTANLLGPRRSVLFTLAVIFSTVLPSEVLPAQPAPSAPAICWRDGWRASCRAVVITNLGLLAIGGRQETVTGTDPITGAPTGFSHELGINARATGDWGVLLKVGRRDALGVSVLGSVESRRHGKDSELGAFVVYRRWIRNEQSIDLGVGTPVILRNSGALRSPYGLVRLNLNNLLSFVLRPEVRRSLDFDTGIARRQSLMFVSTGVEVGEKPGFFLSALGGAILGIVTLIDLHNSN